MDRRASFGDPDRTVRSSLGEADSKARYRAVLESSADGFAVIDQEGRLLEVNDIYLHRSGYSREELLRMRVADLEARDSAEEIMARVAGIVKNGQDIFEGLHRAKDGTLWPVEVNASYWPINSGLIFVFFRDLLRRKRSETLLAARARLSALAEGASLNGLMQATIDQAEIFTGSRIGFFHFVDGDQESIILQAWSSNTLGTMCTAEGLSRHYPISQAGVWVDCFHHRQPVIHQDYASLPNRKGMPPGHAEVTRELTVPIIRGDKVRAIIGVGNKTTDYTAEDVEAVKELASLVMDLVERKQAEEALKLREERLYLAMEAAQQGWFEVNVQTGEVKTSPEYVRMLGYRPEEFDSDLRIWLENLHPDDRPKVEATYKDCVLSGETRSIEYRRRTRSGGWKWIRSAGRIVEYDAAGKPLRMTGTHADISELKNKEEEIRAWGEKFATVFSLTPIPMIITEIDSGRIVDLSEAAAEWLGMTRDEAVGRTTAEVRLWADLTDREQVVRELQEKVFVKAIPSRLRRADGQEKEVLLSSRMMDFEGHPVLLSSIQDITPIRRAEEALRESEERYRTIVENQLEYVDRYRPDGTMTYVNEALARLAGRPAEELLGKSFFPYIHPEDRQSLLDSIASIDREHPTAFFENRVLMPDGSERWHQWSHTALFDHEGKIVEYQAVGRDITARKKAEKELRRSEEFIRAVLDAVDEGFIVVDRDFRVLSANRAYCKLVGTAKEEVCGCFCYEHSHGLGGLCDGRGEHCPVMRVFESGEPQTMTHQYVDPNGRVAHIEVKAFPLRNEAGEITAAIEVLDDITTRQQLEAEQLKTQKLEAIGTLAGGIAHDFNNLLQGVFGYLSLAKLSLDKPEKVARLLDQAEKAMSMSVNLTTQLLTYAKGGQPSVKTTDLQPVIENAARFALSGSPCQVSFQFAADLWPAKVDAGLVGQVIQNLVLNACEAMPLGGAISIAAQNENLATGVLPRLQQGGRFVRIEVKDSGIGIPRKYLERIFDPYFSTKKKGSGLGLATSYSIVKNHGGSIQVETVQGKGSTFIIHLPAGEPRPVGERRAPAERPGKMARVLIMDDEEMVRETARKMLEIFGHQVVCEAEGLGTLTRYREALEAGTPFDVVILDLTIKGGMGGEETVRELLKLDPAAKVVVSSGYSDNPVVANYRQYGFAASLGKPYGMDDLRNCLDTLLAK